MNDLKKKSKASISGNGPNVVRATFSLPGSALIEIDAIRQRFALEGFILNKSEVIRAGLAALESLPSKHVRKTIGEIDRLKAGRPKLGDS